MVTSRRPVNAGSRFDFLGITQTISNTTPLFYFMFSLFLWQSGNCFQSPVTHICGAEHEGTACEATSRRRAPCRREHYILGCWCNETQFSELVTRRATREKQENTRKRDRNRNENHSKQGARSDVHVLTQLTACALPYSRAAPCFECFSFLFLSRFRVFSCFSLVARRVTNSENCVSLHQHPRM